MLVDEACTSCGTILLPSEAAQNFCKHCGEPLTEGNDYTSYDNVYVECEICDTRMEFGTPNCPSCATFYNAEWWAARSKEDIIEPSDDEEIDYSTHPLGWYTRDLNLCCDQPKEDCICLNRIEWDELLSIPPEYVENELYMKDGSSCEECIHYFQPTCLALRFVVREIWRTGESGGLIDGCSSLKIEAPVAELPPAMPLSAAIVAAGLGVLPGAAGMSMQEIQQLYQEANF